MTGWKRKVRALECTGSITDTNSNYLCLLQAAQNFNLQLVSC